MMSSCTKTPHGAELLLQTAIALGDRQADALARLARLSARYRGALFRALHYACHGQMARCIEVLEQELERGHNARSK
jgi:hypothetical protein